MSGTCKDCRHWSEEATRDYCDQYVLNAVAVPQRVCEMAIDAIYGRDFPKDLRKLPTDRAVVNVYEAYPNQLLTGPDFGCIHFGAGKPTLTTAAQ